MRISGLVSIPRSAGLNVAEVPGWQTRGGDFAAIDGVMLHHTAGGHGEYPSYGIVRDGRPGIPGPLANYGIGRSGTIYAFAAGRANHAGVGSHPVVRGRYANPRMIGIEAENRGDGFDPWPERQMDAYVMLCVALARAFSFDAEAVISHAAWATPRGRKVDPVFDSTPSVADIDAFQDRVAAGLRGDTPTIPVIPAVDPATQRPTLRYTTPLMPRSEHVVAVQRALGIVPDGLYGPRSAAAVRAFQRMMNLVPDGIVGPITYRAIDDLRRDGG